MIKSITKKCKLALKIVNNKKLNSNMRMQQLLSLILNFQPFSQFNYELQNLKLLTDREKNENVLLICKK